MFYNVLHKISFQFVLEYAMPTPVLGIRMKKNKLVAICRYLCTSMGKSIRNLLTKVVMFKNPNPRVFIPKPEQKVVHCINERQSTCTVRDKSSEVEPRVRGAHGLSW